MTLIRLDSNKLTYNAMQTNSNPKSNQSKPNQIKTEPTQKITGTKRNETKNEKNNKPETRQQQILFTMS